VLGQEGAKLQRLSANKTAAVEALREQRADIIAAARMERLALPRVGGDDEETLALPGPEVGRCRLTVSKPRCKRLELSA
jgi:hypothetical protein